MWFGSKRSEVNFSNEEMTLILALVKDAGIDPDEYAGSQPVKIRRVLQKIDSLISFNEAKGTVVCKPYMITR